MSYQAAIANGCQWAHTMLGNVMDGCTPEVLHFKAPGSTINPIAAIYVHVVYTEDRLINGLLQGQEPIWQRGGWSEKTGVEIQGSTADPAWAEQLHLDLDRFKLYADAVFAETDAYVRGLTDEQLDREIDSRFGKRSVGWFVNGLVLNHMGLHTGEIASLKGVQGLKGLPF